MEDNNITEILINTLNDENIDVRKTAIKTLEKTGNANAVEPLINILKDKNPDIRISAIEALGNIGNTNLAEILINALNDENPDVRKTAIETIGKTGNTNAVEPLINALKDEDRNIRKTAAEALDRIAIPSDPEILAWYFVAKENWNEAVALGSVAVEPLIHVLKDKDMDLHKGAARALEEIREPSVSFDILKSVLLEIILNNPNNEVRLEALKKINDQKLLEDIVRRDLPEEILISVIDKITDINVIESIAEKAPSSIAFNLMKKAPNLKLHYNNLRIKWSDELRQASDSYYAGYQSTGEHKMREIGQEIFDKYGEDGMADVYWSLRHPPTQRNVNGCWASSGSHSAIGTWRFSKYD
jgi:hypothetical protein